MTGDIKLELTITAEAVEAFFSLLGLVKESREESTKEESKEIVNSLSIRTSSTASPSNNNINNNIVNDGVDVAIKPSIQHVVANPPTMEEVKEYITEKKYNINPFRFFTYYSRRGWVDKGGNDIRESWKETMDYWMNNGVSNNSSIAIPPVDKDSREALKATHPFIPTEF